MRQLRSAVRRQAVSSLPIKPAAPEPDRSSPSPASDADHHFSQIRILPPHDNAGAPGFEQNLEEETPFQCLAAPPVSPVQRTTAPTVSPVPEFARFAGSRAPLPAQPSYQLAIEPPLALPPVLPQFRLAVSQPEDPQEQEAERMAEMVLGMTVARQACAGPGDCDCPHCKEEEQKRNLLQPRLAEGSLSAEHGEPGAVWKHAGPLVHNLVGRGGGQPLNENARSFMEPRFGHDFSRIRVHADEAAAQSAASVGALAYTVGQEVVFGAGRYAPGTPSGDRLIAHELAHTIQQGQSPPLVQRDGDDNPNSDENQRKLIEAAVKASPPDPGLVKKINPQRLSLASEADRLTMIDILANHAFLFVGPNDAYYIDHLWGSFGKDLVNVAQAHFDLWKASASHNLTSLYDLPDLNPVKCQFRSEIVGKAKGYLAKNRDDANREMDRMGLRDPKAPATPAQADNVQKLQKDAERLQKAIKARNRLENATEVIYELSGSRCVSAFNPAGPTPGAGGWGGNCYDPTGLLNPNAFDRYPTWQKTKDEHEKTLATIDHLSSQNPSLYVLAKGQNAGELDTTASSKDQAEVRKTLSETLNTLLSHIQDTEKNLDDPNNDLPLEMWPIHQQLLKTPTWMEPFHNWAADKMVGRHKDDQFWQAVGVGTFQAALFVVAELATGGAATFFLALNALTSGAQAVESWEKYQQMQAAASTSTSKETELLTQGQVSDQLVDAVLATVFAFVDLYSVGSAAREANAAEKLAEAEKGEAEAVGKATVAAEEVHASVPLGNGHDINMTGRGPTHCSGSCPLFTDFWGDALENNRPWMDEYAEVMGSAMQEEAKARALASVDKALQELEALDLERLIATGDVGAIERGKAGVTRLKRPPSERADIANKVLTDEEMQGVLKNAEEMKAQGKLPPDWTYKAPEAKGFVIDPELAGKIKGVLGRMLSENPAVRDCWERAVADVLKEEALTPENYEKLYKSAQGRFWNNVAKGEDTTAKTFFEQHGFVVDGTAAHLDIEGVSRQEVSIGLDHTLPKASGDNWQYALDGDKIQMLMQADNTKLSHIEKKFPEVRR